MEYIKFRKGYFYKRNLPINFQNKDNERFLNVQLCEVSSASIYIARNVKICQYYIFSGFQMLENFCLPIQKRGKVNVLKQWVKLQLFPAISLDKVIWVTDLWSKNYFHWILECLPRILAIREFGINLPILLPEHIYNTPYIQESIKDFGIAAVTFNFRQTVKVNEIFLPSHDFPCAFDKEFLNRVVQAYQILDSPNRIIANRKVYISRRGALKRKITNEDEMIPLLKIEGFDIVQMENLSFKQQRELMRETKVLISIHGAGLANLIFMPDDSKVIELHPDVERYNSCFYHLAAALNREYYYSFEKADHPNPQEANITVDLENLKTLFKNLA